MMARRSVEPVEGAGNWARVVTEAENHPQLEWARMLDSYARDQLAQHQIERQLRFSLAAFQLHHEPLPVSAEAHRCCGDIRGIV